MYQPLRGIRVLDCTRLLPYQYCTMLLGDLGAEVLKVEEPVVGDYGRWGDRECTYESTAFLMANRNKRSMKLNLKHEEGKQIFRKLAAVYDVLIESYRPGVMQRLGLGYQDIQGRNERIIYCSATGYGQTGPYAEKPGHDINYMAISGILGCTGEHTGRPVIPGIPFGDMAGGGVFTALVIIAALYDRQRTGKGRFIDVAQTDVLASLNVLNLAEALSRKKGQRVRPYNLRGASLCYNTYRTLDGKFIAIGALEEKFWNSFCKAVGREEWIPNHLLPYEEGSAATEALRELFASKTQKEWVEFFEKVDTCFTPVLTPEEVMEDPHLSGREVITSMLDPERGETLMVGFPARLSEGLDLKRRPAPLFGQHTEEILVDLGYTEDQIESFKREAVI